MRLHIHHPQVHGMSLLTALSRSLNESGILLAWILLTITAALMILFSPA